MGCVSAQDTYETSFLESVAVNTTENILYAIQPSYKELIPELLKSVSIPVIANGDITSPQKAKEVLAFTGAD